MILEWVVFSVIVLLIIGAVIGMYFKKKKGESIKYTINNDNSFDDFINTPD